MVSACEWLFTTSVHHHHPNLHWGLGLVTLASWNIEMKKLLKYLGIGLLTLVSALLLYAYIAYPAEYVNRLLRWGDSDVYDYQKFPERLIEAPDSRFEFPLALDEDRVRTQFEADSAIDDFDSFLADNRTQAFIVIQDDAIIYEQYFNGASRDSIVTSYSVAKSFTSALIGCTCQQLREERRLPSNHSELACHLQTGFLPE